jgi:hypothetical protein
MIDKDCHLLSSRQLAGFFTCNHAVMHSYLNTA